MRILFLSLCLLFASLSKAQGDTDKAIFEDKYQVVFGKNATDERCLALARAYMGTPYVAGRLDQQAEEQLVINLRQLDCWTFVEYCVAMALTKEADFDAFRAKVQELRYWGGSVNGYASRIHYFSGWVLQAIKAGYFRDVTAELGGEPLYKKINYISANPKKYPKIKDDRQRKNILAAEKRINAHKWYFIPKRKIRAAEAGIRDGDIILFTSSKSNLDIAHEGFAQRLDDGRIHVIHASSVKGKVIVSAQPLYEYCARVKSQSGIMVIRPLN